MKKLSVLLMLIAGVVNLNAEVKKPEPQGFRFLGWSLYYSVEVVGNQFFVVRSVYEPFKGMGQGARTGGVIGSVVGVTSGYQSGVNRAEQREKDTGVTQNKSGEGAFGAMVGGTTGATAGAAGGAVVGLAAGLANPSETHIVGKAFINDGEFGFVDDYYGKSYDIKVNVLEQKDQDGEVVGHELQLKVTKR